MDKRWVVHVDSTEFTLLQLAGEVIGWEPITVDQVKWWTTHWSEDGHFLCTCGAVDKEPKTL